MSRITVPKKLDFKPRKDIEKFFEKEGRGGVVVIPDNPEESFCQCGELKFVWQEICSECFQKNDRR